MVKKIWYQVVWKPDIQAGGRGRGAGSKGQSIGSVNCWHEITGEKNIAGTAIERIDMMHTELNSAENLCENQKTDKKT